MGSRPQVMWSVFCCKYSYLLSRHAGPPVFFNLYGDNGFSPCPLDSYSNLCHLSSFKISKWACGLLQRISLGFDLDYIMYINWLGENWYHKLLNVLTNGIQSWNFSSLLLIYSVVFSVDDVITAPSWCMSLSIIWCCYICRDGFW